jgi:signal transduction histidine kinase
MLSSDEFVPVDTIFSSYLYTRIIIYVALLLTCFLLDSALRQVAKAEAAKAQEQALAVEVAALDRVNQLKTDLMRTISHETLTPLAVIMGFAEITAENARKSGMGGDLIINLDTIADESKRMAAMMEEMRQLALAKTYHKERQSVDVGKVIRQVAGLYAKIFEQKNIAFTTDITAGLPLVYGSESELIQVIFNLLRNSDNHTKSGSALIRAESTEGYIKVTVSDTGTGITPELLPRVFERGVHGDNDGSGFGLAISRDIIAAYGGEIWAESDGESGTDVAFTLPVYTTDGGEK